MFLLNSKLIKKVIDLFPNSFTGKTAFSENLLFDLSKFKNLDPLHNRNHLIFHQSKV